jgi:hypothetical protein
MKINEIFGSFKQWKSNREKLPVPPKTNLYHVTLSHNWPSIQRQGLIPGGVCQLYDACDGNYVYLADDAGIATGIIGSSDIPKQELDKSGGIGVILLINSTKLKPELLSSDPGVPTHWANPKYTYRYEGTVPAQAIIQHKEFQLDAGYYLNKQFKSLRPGKPGPKWRP